MTTPAFRRHARRTAKLTPAYLMAALSTAGMFLGMLSVVWLPMGLLTLASPGLQDASGPLPPGAVGALFVAAGAVGLVIGAVSLVTFVLSAIRLRRAATKNYEAYIRDINNS